ncbi:MAG TPA: enoyl-CoA hydratase, partial [Allosphingosinicella sp.]
GERWGFHNRLVEPGGLLEAAHALARELAAGPSFAHGITKTQLNQEWNVSLETAIEMEAQAQALCMATNDFRRAFEAFAAKKVPEFRGD